MTDKEKIILDTFAKLISKMSEQGQDKLLFYGRGIEDAPIFKKENKEPKATLYGN